MHGRATIGVFKTGLSQAVRLLVQFGSVIMLSRLLLPSEFGVLAMAGPIVAFAALFQDLGLTQAIVQKSRLSQAEVSMLFFFSLGMSLGLAILLLAVSPLASWFYGQARVGTLTAAMGMNVIVGGAGSLPYALLNRRMQFGALAVIDAVGAVGGLAVSILFAILYHSFWALYAGSLASCLIPTAGAWIAVGWRPSLPRLNSGVGVALRFGANVTGFNIANFFARNLDNVLIGHAWGERSLGLYDRAYKLLLLPLQQINGPISKVMLPVLSQMMIEPERYRRAFLRTLAQILLTTLPGVAFMVGTSDILIPALLGQQWADASRIFTALGMAAFLQILNNPAGLLFMTQSRTREFLHWGVFGSVTAAGSFLIGLPYGPFGVAVAYAVSECVRTPILWWYVTRRGPIRLFDITRIAVPHFSGALASLAAVIIVRLLLPPSPVLIIFFSFIISFGMSVLVVAIFGHGRETIRETFALIRVPVRSLFTS